MNTNKLSFLLYSLALLFMCSCVRKPKKPLLHAKEKLENKDYLYLRDGKPFGILRVECNDCQMIYTVNKKEFVVDIKEGNEDRFIYPKPNSYIKTHLKSHDNQMIRVLAINPNGKIVSNVLDTFVRDQQSKNEYSMKYIKLKTTVVVDILKKAKKK
jgi:hypothetical protein